MGKRNQSLSASSAGVQGGNMNKSFTKLGALAGTLALGFSPAIALAAHDHGRPSSTPASTNAAYGQSHRPSTTSNSSTTPGPKAPLPAKAKAYGVYCRGESKKHVTGTPGTPFSKCVTDMAKLANGSAKNPTTACKNESKKHVAGMPGTPYSVCVSGGAKMLKQSAGSSTSSS
jgi:hypothetical protein